MPFPGWGAEADNPKISVPGDPFETTMAHFLNKRKKNRKELKKWGQ